jgi:conjugal transfer pilus assembly protein TraW
VRIRFSKFVRVSCLLGLTANAPASLAGAGVFNGSQEIPDQTAQGALPDWLSRPPAQLDPAFEALLRKGGQASIGVESASPPDPKTPSRSEGRWLLLSFAMPEADLKAALRFAAAHGVTAAFRGVEPGGTLNDFFRRVHGLVRDIQPTPAVTLDPFLFRSHAATVAPTLVSAVGGPARSVSGLLDIAWLDRQEPGRHGVRGPAVPVSETDLVEEMRNRMAKIDWEAEKARAVAGYWRRAQWLDLPETQREAERAFDPSVRVTRDIPLPDGGTLARAGDLFNPQKAMPLSRVLVFFDATRPGQVKRALALGKEAAGRRRPVVYLTSRIDPARGWGHLADLHRDFDGPVYLLNESVARRFRVERLPAVLEGRGDALVIRDVLPLPP